MLRSLSRSIGVKSHCAVDTVAAAASFRLSIQAHFHLSDRMNRPRPATAAARTTSPPTKLAATHGIDAGRSFDSSLGVSKAFPMTREVYTTNMNIGLPTVKQKNMSEDLLRLLERPRPGSATGKLKHDAQQASTVSVKFGSRPGTATPSRNPSANAGSSNLVTPLFSAYGVSEKKATPSFAPTQFLQRPISASRTILRPPSASSTTSFASSKRLPSASSTRPSEGPTSSLAQTRANPVEIYAETKHSDHHGVGAAKLVELTQKLVMRRMENLLDDADGVPWQTSEGTFLVDLPFPATSSTSATGSASANPQPWMRLHGDTEEIIVRLDWSGSAPAVPDSVRHALIQSLGVPAAIAKLHQLCRSDGPNTNMADLDLSVIMLDDKLAVMDVIYYNNLCSRDCSLLHSGDSTQTGQSSESAVITLSKVSPSVHAIAFGINIHGTVPPQLQQQRAVSSEGRPSSSSIPKSEHHAETSATLDALVAADVLWLPERCTMRVFSSVHSFMLASYNISFVASDDVWNPKLTRRPMSGGGRLRTLSKSSSLDNLADSDADVEMVGDSDGDAAWDELDKTKGDSVAGQGRRAGRFLGSSLRRSISETRMASVAGPNSEKESSTVKANDSAACSRDLVQQVAFAAGESETATVQYIDWISFVDSCDATGNLHIQREVCLAAFRDAAAALVDTSSSETDVSTHPLPLSRFASMLLTLLPPIREAEYKLPNASTLRLGMEAMCASLGCDSRQPLSEQVVDISCVQRGANVFCLHRGNQSCAFAASVAAKNARSAGKQMESIDRTWFLQTIGTVNLAVNLVQNLAPLRELLVMSGVFIPVIVAVEYCTALRPSVSLRGNSSDFLERYNALKVRVERSLPFVKVEANPTWLLPGGPRISAFEVFFQDPANMHCVCIHSKSESKCWPKPSEIVAKMQRLIQAREKAYKLPVDLCPVRLACLSTFNHMSPLPGVPVRIYRIGDENEIPAIAADAGAPAAQLHSLCAWQGDGVHKIVTSDASALCFSGRSASDGIFTTRLSAGVYVATIGGDDVVREHALLIVRTLQKQTVTADIALKPRLFRLSGRVINGSSGSPMTHGAVSLTSVRGDSDAIVVELARSLVSDAVHSSSPVPQLPITRVPQPDTFSDCSGSETGQIGEASGRDEIFDAQGVSQRSSVPSSAVAVTSVSSDSSLVPPNQSFSADSETISSTIFAVVNDAADDFNSRADYNSPRALSDNISKMTGTFEVMLPQGEYTLSVNIHGYNAGGVFKVNMRRGALHMGILSVHPDSDMLLLNSLRDLRSKQRFHMQGILSTNMPVVSAVLAQASSAEAATAAAASEAAATKKRVLRTKFARSADSNPASFVSSYRLSVPLVLLRGVGVVADKSGKISIRHRTHRFSSLSLPPSSCRPSVDATAVSELVACKSKAAHIARHILCGSSYDFVEKLCTIDSRALSDDKDIHRASFTLVVQTGDCSADAGGTFMRVGCGGRLAAIAGIPVAFTLQLNDRCMSPCLSHNENASVQCSVRFGQCDMLVNVFEAANIGLGRYVVSFTPPMDSPGVYTVSCTVNRVHVEGSPFSVTVAPHEPAVTSCSRLTLQPTQSCLPWPHCSPVDDDVVEDTPTVVVTQVAPALVVSGWYAPFELYNEETCRWVGSSNTVGEVDVVFLIEICLENQPLVDALRCTVCCVVMFAVPPFAFACSQSLLQTLLRYPHFWDVAA